MTKWAGLVVAALGLIGTAAHAQQAAKGPAAGPAIDKAKLSYAIGYQIGSQFADGDPAVDLATLERAIQDAAAKRQPSVPMQDMRAQLRALDDQMHARAVNEFRRVAAANARKSEQYMAHNRTQPGVVQLASGVQYAVIKQGRGTVSPTVDSKVTVNYRGMLIDGTEFDSTFAHGNPVSFVVKSVIPGWRDVIPPRLAYGERGALPRIGPNEALVFDIELLDVANP